MKPPTIISNNDSRTVAEARFNRAFREMAAALLAYLIDNNQSRLFDNTLNAFLEERDDVHHHQFITNALPDIQSSAVDEPINSILRGSLRTVAAMLLGVDAGPDGTWKKLDAYDAGLQEIWRGICLVNAKADRQKRKAKR